MPEEAGQVKCRLVGQVCCRWWVRCAAGLQQKSLQIYYYSISVIPDLVQQLLIYLPEIF